MFCITSEVPALKVDIMLAWQRFSHTTSTYPCPTVTRNIVERMPISEGLLPYVVSCYAYYMDIEDMKKNRLRLNTIPSEFLTEVLILSRTRTEENFDEMEPDYRWCEYHGHDTEESKEACRNQDGQEDDPDVQYRYRMMRPRRYGGCC